MCVCVFVLICKLSELYMLLFLSASVKKQHIVGCAHLGFRPFLSFFSSNKQTSCLVSFLPMCHACMSEHLKCWVPDNSSLPSQLQFRQDSGVFPVTAMPGYFLFVLIRSCMFNENMLIRDSKMYTSLNLWLFQMIYGHPLWFVPK